MDRVGNYKLKNFSKWRKNITLITHEGWRKHEVHAFLELDVTRARRLLKEYKEIKRERISFTGWVVKCLAETFKVYPDLNCYRHGRSGVVVFEDVDVAVPVERSIDGEPVPMALLIRKANNKDVKEITREIRKAQKKSVDGSDQVLFDKSNLSFTERFALKAPLFLQRIVIRLVRRNGILKKKYMGTVGVTSVGMKGHLPGGIIPIGGTPTILLVLAGINKKPVFIDGKVVPREILSLTISADHDLIDGGPLVRFIDTFTEFIESGFCLEEIKK